MTAPQPLHPAAARRIRIEPDRTFIGSMCLCGQHPRVWTIRQLLKAWEMGRGKR